MKKILTLCAAGLMAGALTVEARYWKTTTELSATEIEVGKWYAFQTAWSMINENSVYLAGQRHTSSYNITTENLYCFEATGETTADGYPVYYIKRFDGEYLYANTERNFYGNAVERAWKVTVKDAMFYDSEELESDEEGNDIVGMDAYVYRAQQEGEPFDLSNATYVEEGPYVVIAGAEANDVEDPYSTYSYLCGLGNGATAGAPSKGVNYNTNAWAVVIAKEMDAKESLVAKMEEIADGDYESLSLDDYQLGTGAGEYSDELYNAFMTLWNRALAIANGASATEEEMDELAEQLEPALDAFRNSGKGLSEGYYILYNMRTQEETFATYGAKWPYVSNGSGYDGGAMYDGGAVNAADDGLRWSCKKNDGVDIYFENDGMGHVSVEGGYTYDIAKYVWRAFKSGNKDNQGNDLYYFQNLETDRYIGNIAAAYQPIKMTEEPTTDYTIATNPYIPGWFCFYSPQLPPNNDASAPSKAEYSGIHTERGNSNVVAWDWRNAGSCWKVITLNEEEVALLREAMDGPKTLAQLTALADKAQDSLNKGYTYAGYDADGNKCPEAASGDTETLSGLVVSEEQVASEASDSDEGNLAALFDGDETTYHHSDWHGNFNGKHYLQFSIEQPEDALLLKWAKRQCSNYNNGSPTTFDLYATTDEALLDEVRGTVVNEDGDEVESDDYWMGLWTKVGSGEFNYAYRSATNYNFTDNNVGTAYVKCADGRYQYFRLVPTGRVTNANAWFHASEFRVYRGAYDPESSLINAVPQEIVDALVEVLEVAKAEIEDEAATKETLAKLQAAYDAFLAHYPDPSRISEAIASARAILEAAEEGEGLGYYSEGSKDALEAVIESVEGKIKALMTVDEINELLAQLNAGIAEFDAAFQVPTSAIYVLQSMSSNVKNKGRIICAVTSSEQENVKIISPENKEDLTQETRPGAFWQVEKVDGGYTYKNLYTGMYLAPFGKENRNVVLSETPYVFALQFAKAPGCFNLVVAKADANADNVYANADPSGVLVTWNTAEGNDNSAWAFREVSADDVNAALAWGVKIDVPFTTAPQIFTFPVDLSANCIFGNFYTVAGQSDNMDIQLSLVEGKLNAGQAYVFIPNSEAQSTNLIDIADAQDFTALQPTRETIDVNGLIATFETVELEDNYGVFNAKHTEVLLSEAGELVAANTGYFAAMPEVKTVGDATLKCNGFLTTEKNGILNVIDNRADNKIYTLSGVRINGVNNLPAGLYIVNGKKYIVK